MKSYEELDGWERARRDQLRQWMSTTPAQRLAALEELIDFVRKVRARTLEELREDIRSRDSS